MSKHIETLQSIHAPVLSQAAQLDKGRALRGLVPRSSHAAYVARDRDPLAILAEQNASRIPELIPLRFARTAASPFTFYRGTAAIQAYDMAAETVTGIDIVSCGDAHISNFGLFASPQRTIMFDLNDFDESAVGPWEWDVKRLAASVVVGALDSGHSLEAGRDAARHSVWAYRCALREMMPLGVLERYYMSADVAERRTRMMPRSQGMLDKAVRQASRRTSASFVRKVITVAPDGSSQLIEQPPVLTHLSDEEETWVEQFMELYRLSVRADIRVVLSQFRLVDAVRRVVGVGSVGTRCYLLFLVGPSGEPFVLQVKEAQPSVLETYGGRLQPKRRGKALGQGARVVAAQRTLQAVSDPFLGHCIVDEHHFYVRQFRDYKGSFDTAEMNSHEYIAYVDACGALLARAHAQSPDAAVIAGYLGKSDVFDRAIAEWAVAYSDQSHADYSRLREAIASGAIATA